MKYLFHLLIAQLTPKIQLLMRFSLIVCHTHHIVSVREPISLKYAKDRLSLSNVVEGADASVGYDFGASPKKRSNSSVPWVVLGDSSGLRGNGSVVADDIERLIVKFHSIGFRIKLLDCSTPYSNVIGKLARKYGCDWLSDHWLDFLNPYSKNCVMLA